MNILLYLAVVFAICVIIAIISSVLDNKIFRIRRYSISSSKIVEDCKIVFLSDLHGNRFGKDNKRLIEAVDSIKPDIVIVGGDMITAKPDKADSKNWENAFSLIKGLQKYPMYYGIGNHEYRMNLYREDYGDSFDRYRKELEDNGADVLYNDGTVIDKNNIAVRGLVIDRKFYKRFERNVLTFEDVEEYIGRKDDNYFNIILAHNPEYFNEYAKHGDLILSGHVHGGIMRLPLIGGVISPRLRPFPKYDGGKFEAFESTMIVSRGLGSHTIPVRVFNPCEICVIDLHKM